MDLPMTQFSLKMFSFMCTHHEPEPELEPELEVRVLSLPAWIGKRRQRTRGRLQTA